MNHVYSWVWLTIEEVEYSYVMKHLFECQGSAVVCWTGICVPFHLPEFLHSQKFMAGTQSLSQCAKAVWCISNSIVLVCQFIA